VTCAVPTFVVILIVAIAAGQRQRHGAR